jgi:hypothetical protein
MDLMANYGTDAYGAHCEHTEYNGSDFLRFVGKEKKNLPYVVTRSYSTVVHGAGVFFENLIVTQLAKE